MVNDCSAQCVALWHRMKGKPQDKPKGQPAPSASISAADNEIIAKAKSAKNGQKFSRLWDGDLSAHRNDHNAADQALCNLLGFYCGNDPARIDQLFRQSGLCRDKWTQRADYRESTIHNALDGRTEFYKWNSNGNGARSGGHHKLTAHGQGESPVAIATKAPSLFAPEGRTERANAQRLAIRFGQDMRWCEPLGKWFVWDGRRYANDQECAPEAKAKIVADEIWAQALEIAKTYEKLAVELVRFGKATSSAFGIRNMLSLFKSETGIPILPDAMDRDPWLLNLNNGTLDLRTKELRPHRRGDCITKLAPVAYDPVADCPTWREYLRTTFDGNQKLIGFIQRAAGYSLSAITTERCLFFLHGAGRNGKTIFATTMQKLLGDYATSITTEMLMVSYNQQHPTENCDLMGARLAVAAETEDNRRLAESRIKQLCGGEDRIKGRRMRADFQEFSSTFKLWISGNHRPRVSGTDDGIWDRIRLIPFTVRIERPDKQLPKKLEAELPGILNWAALGSLDWQQHGLAEPSEVTDATAAYRSEMDVLGRFMDECCIVADDASALAKDLFTAYCNWAGDKAMTQTAFGLKLADKGFASGRVSSGRKQWIGIGVNQAP